MSALLGARLVETFLKRYPQVKLQIIDAFSGYVNEWLSGRQFGRWAQRPPAKADPNESLKQLREDGVIDDAELEQLRSRIKA